MARVRKGLSRKSTVTFDVGLGDSDDSESTSIATPGRRRKTIFQQADDSPSVTGTQSIPLLRSRGLTEASQASDINDDLWAENQELHDRILDLEGRLTEVQADNEELAALNMDSQWKKRYSEKRMSPVGLVDIEKVEELESARTRLIWQKAILAIRLQNATVRQRIARVKVAAMHAQRQSSYEELQRKLARSEAERIRMASGFELERARVRRTLEDQALELEKARADLDLRSGESDDCFGAKNTCSLVDDLKMEVTPSMTPRGSTDNSPSNRASRAASGCRGSSTDTAAERLAAAARASGDELEDCLGHAVALTRIEEQHEEIEELQQYTRALEAQLADVVCDHEELYALRGRVRQLEKTAWAGEAKEGEQSWFSSLGWCAFERNFCATGRTPNFADAAPAPFKLNGREQESAALRLQGATSGSSHSSTRSARSSRAS